MSNKHRKDSFLRFAPVLDGSFLDVNKLPTLKSSTKDELYEIGHAFEERPDLLAFKLYSNANLWWVFSLRNPDVLKDPIRDFIPGKQIYLPSPESVQSMSEGSN